MKKIFVLLFLISVIFFSPDSAAAVNEATAEVKIDITAESAAAAREKGMSQAYRSAFLAVAGKNTNEEGLARLEKLTDAQLINFVKEATVVSEKASDVRYIATLRITINTALLKTFMQEQSINYIVNSSANVLIVPIFRRTPEAAPQLWEEDNLWRRQWEENAVTTSPNIYVSIPSDNAGNASLSAEKALSLDGQFFDKAATRTGTRNIFILNAVGNGENELKITIIPFENGSPKTFAVSGENMADALSLAQNEAVQKIDSLIRRQKISEGNRPAEIMVLYDCRKLSDWIKVENKIKEINSVNNVNTIAMGKGKVQFKLSFIGSIEDLSTALREKLLQLTSYNNFYTLSPVTY